MIDTLVTGAMLYSRERRLFEAFPRLYANRNKKNAPMERGMLVGDGWFDLLWRLSSALEPLVAVAEASIGSGMGSPVPRAYEVGETNGELKFVMAPRENVTTDMLDLIRAAENEAIVTCEICGDAGRYKLRNNLTQTLCERHETMFSGRRLT